MGLAKLQIWFTAEAEPCRISERDTHDNMMWEVAIMHCDGTVLKWCDRNYVGIKAPCGHVEIAVPPGCYVIRGGESMGINPHGGITGNHLTDHAVVTACCDDEICVMLFAPSLHNCLFGVAAALNAGLTAKTVPAEAKTALAAIRALQQKLPSSDFDKQSIPLLEEMLKGVNSVKK